MPDFGSSGNVTMPHFGSMWNIKMPNFTSLSNTSSSETQSTSIETVVKDGHMIKKTRTCKNSKCNTTTEDKKIVAPKGDAVLIQGPDITLLRVVMHGQSPTSCLSDFFKETL